MLDAEGDTFVYLLKTQAIIPLHLKNFGRRGMVNYTEAFFERERGLELHLVQFTEVIDSACLTFQLHPVCEYVRNLCKKFTCYWEEVLQHLDLKTFRSKLFLCDASRVVMQKCFHLLGITPVGFHLLVGVFYEDPVMRDHLLFRKFTLFVKGCL
nr:arginine--tRNA ligase, chloroplastic/mitochondrial [Tanacetum cinerariifolium]